LIFLAGVRKTVAALDKLLERRWPRVVARTGADMVNLQTGAQDEGELRRDRGCEEVATMTKQRWLKPRKKTDPEIPVRPPILLGTLSNGEFYKEETPRDRKIRDMILQKADENARHVGMDRREFLASSMGMATSLAVLNMVEGCGRNRDGTISPMSGDSGAAPPQGDGGFAIPQDAMVDCSVANQVLGAQDFFILDLQTHFIEDETTWKERHPNDGAWDGAAWGQALDWDTTCTLSPDECIGPGRYIDKVLLNSQTTVAVLSGFPSPICDDATLCTNLNSNDDMAYNRDRFNTAAGGSQRVVQHCQVAPNDRWSLQKEMMQRVRSKYGNHGWKCYPPWGADGNGWWLDDPTVADPFFEYCVQLGEPLVCAHKGFPLAGFDRVHTDPKDVGPAALKHPEITFVIYHSAYESGIVQGEYGTVLDPSGALQSVDRLCKTVMDNKLMGKNVYAEMGSAWALCSSSPTQAQHYIGKLLKYIGEDNICWGSECVWFGSPQPQIEAFRTLTISQEFQATYGYPALTDAIKAKIFGLNGARLYGIDPDQKRCSVDAGKLAQLKRDLDGEFGSRRWAFQRPEGPTTRREFAKLQSWRKFLGKPG
jgi:predicted TIM-barrel fold metal-dependent hydrolase